MTEPVAYYFCMCGAGRAPIAGWERPCPFCQDTGRIADRRDPDEGRARYALDRVRAVLGRSFVLEADAWGVIFDELAAVRAEEREACARIAESPGDDESREGIGRRIRARGEA